MRSHGESGITLIEVLIVIAIIGLFASISIPAFNTINRRAAVRAAAKELRTIFHLARSRAIARGRNAGVKFSSNRSEWTYALYDDGDGDGVRNDDIASGVDRCFQGPRRVLAHSRLASIGLPAMSIVAPDGQPLAPSSSPVRFGPSAICSFSPVGESTPGTVYLTDRIGDVWALRVLGASARIRLLRYMGGTKWEAR